MNGRFHRIPARSLAQRARHAAPVLRSTRAPRLVQRLVPTLAPAIAATLAPALTLATALALALAVTLPARDACAADRAKFDELAKIMDTGKAAEADVFAPKAWAKASERFASARTLLEQSRKQSDIDKVVAEAREYAENAGKATQVGKLSLQQYLEPRNKAKAAKAPLLVTDLYTLAETKFLEATAKVEGGDVKGGLRRAAEATPLFDKAEDAAIRVEILGPADKLIDKAVVDEAVKYAPSTLDAARSARKRGDAVLTKDRYNRTESVKEAKHAEYEARHASNIATSVRSLNRNDQAWEKLMLLYEIQMNRFGQKMGWEYLPFDNGPIAATDSVVAFIEKLQGETARTKSEKAENSAQLTGQMQQLRGGVSQQLQQVLARLAVASEENDPVKLAQLVDQKVGELVAEKAANSEKSKATELKLAELTTVHQEASAQLQARQAKDDRFTKAKQTLNPSEGEILLNANGDVVLRLSGISFDPGKADIKDAHVPLLQKVESIFKLYPDATYVVEGHTDASGEGVANQQLSEKRAFALMQYLRQGLSIPADRIKAIGYGAEKPIASNAAPDGRAKNRRIDILILQ
jgi:outer membrane protein OmpA-like peptidoglycan-associated protein